MITPQSRLLLRLHGHYRNNLLPLSGGFLDQPNFYAEAMEILNAHAAEMDAEAAVRLRRES